MPAQTGRQPGKAFQTWKILRALWPTSCATIRPGPPRSCSCWRSASRSPSYRCWFPAWGALVAIGALIGVSGISFWPVWLAGGLGAALGDWVSYWFGYSYKEHVAEMWPLSRYPDILPRGEAFVKDWGVPSIFIGRFFGPLAGLGAARRRDFRDAVLAVSDREFFLRAGLVGGAAAVRRRDGAYRRMAVAGGLRLKPE